MRVWLFECKDPSHHAFVLGLFAAILLGAAHVLVNLVGGCCNFSRDELQKAAPSKKLSMACLVFTWYNSDTFDYLLSSSRLMLHVNIKNIMFRIILGVAMSMLVIGTKSNHKSRASCGFTHHHLLSTGGILCMVHSLFAVAYYVTSTAVLH